jgi:carbon monoxide dehydrogenase subunit G
MASITREVAISIPAESAWTMIRDFGEVQRIVPGFVVACELDGDDRIVTFASGRVARELLVDIDDTTRRLVYAEPTEPFITRNASLQVFSEGEGKARVVWIIDVLPNTYAAPMRESMEKALTIMKETMESSQVRR